MDNVGAGLCCYAMLLINVKVYLCLFFLIVQAFVSTVKTMIHHLAAVADSLFKDRYLWLEYFDTSLLH